MATLDTGDGDPNDVLNGVINFLGSDGGNLGTLLQGSIFGLVVSVATGGINFVQSVFALVVAPLDSAADIVAQFFESTVLAPLGIAEATAETSAAAISAQFGPFALPVGIAVILIAFWIMIQFLEEESTPDFVAIPGFPDIPDVGPFDPGVEEEDDDEEQ